MQQNNNTPDNPCYHTAVLTTRNGICSTTTTTTTTTNNKRTLLIWALVFFFFFPSTCHSGWHCSCFVPRAVGINKQQTIIKRGLPRTYHMYNQVDSSNMARLTANGQRASTINQTTKKVISYIPVGFTKNSKIHGPARGELPR